jgi:hypothetical protein
MKTIFLCLIKKLFESFRNAFKILHHLIQCLEFSHNLIPYFLDLLLNKPLLNINPNCF